MAKRFDYEYLPGVIISDTYSIIGETRINHFHETVEIDFYIFVSEDARNQLESVAEELRRPLKIITVKTPIENYLTYIATVEPDVATAGYALVTAVDEGTAAQPWGLATLLTGATDV